MTYDNWKTTPPPPEHPEDAYELHKDIIAVISDWGEISYPHLCSELGCHPDDTRGDVVQETLQELLRCGVVYQDGNYYGVKE